jgi:hypothetical protein
VIVAYTEAELNCFREYAVTDLGPWYRNAHRIGQRWMGSCHPEARRAKSLAAFEAFIGFERKPHLRGKNAAKRLRAAMRAAECGFEKLTPCRKGKWTKLLDYNRVDLEAAQALTVRAAGALAGRASFARRGPAPPFERPARGLSVAGCVMRSNGIRGRTAATT